MKMKLARFIVRARIPLLILTLIAAVASALCIGKTNINYDLTRYLSKDTMTRRALTVMEQEFGSTEQLRVMFTDRSDEELEGYVSAINDMPGVLLAVHDPEDSVTAEGRTFSLVTVTLDDTDASQVVTSLRGMFPDAGTYYVGGSAADQLDIQRSVADEMPLVLLIAVIVVLALLLITSHAWLEPVVTLIVLAISILINMGTNFIFPDVSFITFAVSAILQLALSIDYAIMLLHTFNGHRDAGLDAKQAMVLTLDECFMRITSSALTTIAGLLSLLFMSFTIGFDIGLVLSTGILCSMLGVFLFMPSVILLLERPLYLTRHRPIDAGGDRLARAITRVRKPLAVTMILVIFFGLYLNSRVEYSFTNGQSGTESASAQINARFGRSDPLVLLVPGGEEDEDYERQRELVRKLLAIRMKNGESAVTDVASMVTTGEMALKYYTPQDVAEMTGQSTLAVNLFFKMQGFGSSVRGDRLLAAAASLAGGNEQIRELGELMDTARSAFMGPTRARLLAEPGFTSADPDSAVYMEQILAAAREVYGDDCYVTGMLMSNYDISNAFSGDLIRVNLITLLAILLIVVVSFRSFGMAILVFVIEGAIWITMGISRLFNEPIFFISYLICLSIQMGATIDYGILLSDQYRALRGTGAAPAEALAQAMKRSLPTVLTSGTILVVAGYIIGKKCSIFYIYSIGLMVARGALVSVILVLTLLPALLLLCDRVIVRGRRGQAGPSGGKADTCDTPCS